MELTTDTLDRADLIVIVGDDGLTEWTSKKSAEWSATALEALAADIRAQIALARNAETASPDNR